MKMLVFESSFQQALPELCKPSNNFYRVPKVFSIKNVNSMKCTTLKAYNYEFKKILEFQNIKFTEQNESLLLSMYYEFEIFILRLKSILIFAPDTNSLYQKNGCIYISFMCEIFRSLRSKHFFH